MKNRNNSILKSRIMLHKKNSSAGVYSVCSSNRFVLEAAMLQAKQADSFLLVESTSNQVDQYGGYSGMTPAAFRKYVMGIAEDAGFDQKRLILGGDHLGPNVWQKEAASLAMDEALVQISEYARAGFLKFHLDTSMVLGDDGFPEGSGVPVEVAAERAAMLCNVVEVTYKTTSGHPEPPVYVIGNDVPVPGGAFDNNELVEITDVKEVEETLDIMRKVFIRSGLEEAWERVIALVVQPGVEFSDNQILAYNRKRVQKLSEFMAGREGLVFEMHSSDYQLPRALKEMVEDHFAILKVGPWLTLAFREAVFALADIENILACRKPSFSVSGIRKVIEHKMTIKPQYWARHYSGTAEEKRFARSYSLSDRIRYYWPDPDITSALNGLISNLRTETIPMTLISQYLPDLYWKVREGLLRPDPEALVHGKIQSVLNYYIEATGMTHTQ
jgi:D-tagatose-1,6-bisphosphate aldolase subunit GatZ/KbaZ